MGCGVVFSSVSSVERGECGFGRQGSPSTVRSPDAATLLVLVLSGLLECAPRAPSVSASEVLANTSP